jgi:hypothetical protein
MLGTLLAIMPIMAVAAAVEANHANGPLKTTSLGYVLTLHTLSFLSLSRGPLTFRSAITIGILLIAVLPLQVLSTRYVPLPPPLTLDASSRHTASVAAPSPR